MKSITALQIIFLCHLAYCHGQATTVATDHQQQQQTIELSSTQRPVTTRTTVSLAPIYEAHASRFLELAGQRMRSIYARKRELFNELVKTVKFNFKNQEMVRHEIDNEYHNLMHELATNLSVIPVRYLRNATLKRQVQRLSKLQLHGLKKGEYQQATQLLSSLQSFVTSPLPCDPKDNTEIFCKKSMMPHIISNITQFRADERLEYFWHKWRLLLNEDDRAKTTFINYVRLFRKAAEYNGHVTASRTWYLYYETENFQRELEDVLWEIMPLYEELHAYLRYWARIRYGEGLTDGTDGAIPAHVMEQMILQDWSKPAVFEVPVPNRELPTVRTRLTEIFSPPKIIQKADEFFASLGLDHLPNNISSRIADMGSERECRSEVHYFPPTVALRYCTKMDYRVLLRMHGEVAQVQYNLFKKDLPFGLDTEPCPGFGDGLAEAAVISAGTPRHLHRLKLITNETLPDNTTYNRLFRMGIHTLLSIPQYFVNDRYLVDVMDGRVSPHEYNCAYWRLQYKYAGVRPPNRRTEKNFDPDYKFYRFLHPEKTSTIKLISEVLGFQFLRTFCLISGQYKPGNISYPLYECDFYGSKPVGEKIKTMMKMGATEHWRNVLEVATGERRLSGKGVMEYFGPLYVWLKEKNKELGLIKGWDDDIQCTNS